jgi:hypothetical protein
VTPKKLPVKNLDFFLNTIYQFRNFGWSNKANFQFSIELEVLDCGLFLSKPECPIFTPLAYRYCDK